LISAGANYCVCYTEAGILYYWGMLVPDNYESIEYLPNFLGIVLPEDASEEALIEFHLTHIATTFREVLACDSTGRVYHCNLNNSQTLKPYAKELQKQIGSAHQVLVGRSVHIFIDQLLSLGKCKLAEPLAAEFETLVPNQVALRLCDTDSRNYYLAKAKTGTDARGEAEEETKGEEEPAAKPISVPITVVFN